MEINRCKRCGAFFMAANSVCPNCEIKDSSEISKLKTFLSENNCPESLETLAVNTGISEKNLNRFLEEEDFATYASTLGISNVKIDL